MAADQDNDTTGKWSRVGLARTVEAARDAAPEGYERSFAVLKVAHKAQQDEGEIEELWNEVANGSLDDYGGNS